MRESAEERGLVAGIIEEPDADAPRLIYADWLEDHGEAERAEFIRGQLALAGMAADDPSLLPLLRRSSELERRLEDRIFRDCPKWAEARRWSDLLIDQPPHAVDAESRCWRGFPIQGYGDAHDWMTRGGPVFDRVPLHGLSVYVSDAAEEFGDWPELQRLRAMELELEGVEATASARLLASHRLAELRFLRLYRADYESWSAAEFGALGRSAPLSGLPALALREGRATAATVAALGSGGLRGLRILSLEDVAWEGGSLGELVATGHLARLDSLRVWERIDPAALPMAGFDGAGLPRPRRLLLERNELPPAAFQAIAAAGMLDRVEDLSLAGNALPDGLPGLLGRGPELLRLDFGGCDIGDSGARAIAVWPRLRRLADLRLGANRLTPAGFEALAGSTHLRSLRRLDLNHNPLGPEGASTLAASPLLATLDTLGLEACALGPEGVSALVASPRAVGLRDLDLSGNELGDAGAEALLRSPLVESLERLNVAHNRIGPHMQLALRQKMGPRVRT